MRLSPFYITIYRRTNEAMTYLSSPAIQLTCWLHLVFMHPSKLPRIVQCLHWSIVFFLPGRLRLTTHSTGRHETPVIFLWCLRVAPVNSAVRPKNKLFNHFHLREVYCGMDRRFAERNPECGTL